jgi:predicted nucleic acid-binding protein
MVFVDSNVILDVITADPLWQAWSEDQLSRWLDRGPLLINPIVYAEIAFACEAIETVDDLLPAHLYAYRPIPPLIHASINHRASRPPTTAS